MITPFTRTALMTDFAADMLVAVTNSKPSSYSSDCVAHRSAVRLVMARTFREFNIAHIVMFQRALFKVSSDRKSLIDLITIP
jgi:hypothetical protein